MPLRPCLTCGRPSRSARCPACTRTHDQQRRPSPRDRGYDAEYRRNRRLLLADHPRCHWCGDLASTADHVIPVSKGGTNDQANLVPACPACNSGRGNRGTTSTGEGGQPTGG